MATIENQDPNNLKALIDLLTKVTKYPKQCGLDINWSGDKFSWTVKTSNITAEEWNPIIKNQRLPHGIEVKEERVLVHRK